MTHATPLNSVTSRVNERQFLEHLKMFFSTSCVMLAEAMQNARRAGADEVCFEYDKEANSLVISDNGCGIEDFQALLTVAESGWDKQTIDDERPFGIGFFSVCFAAARVRVQSRGQQIAFGLDDLVEKRPIAIEPSDTHERTIITLEGCKLDEEKMERSIREYASGFPIPVYWQGVALPSPHAMGRLSGTTTPVGFIHAPGIHGKDAPVYRPDFKLYCQGLPIHFNGPARRREYGCDGVIIHVDHRRYLPRMPDRDVLIDSEQACEDFDAEVSNLWRELLRKRKRRLSARSFADKYWRTAKALGCLDLMCDVPVLPVCQLSLVEGVAVKWSRYMDDQFMAQPRSPVTLEMVQNGKVKLFHRFDISDRQEDGDCFARLMWARGTKALFVGELPEGHWAAPHVRNLFELPLEMGGSPVATQWLEAEWVSRPVNIVEGLSVTMDGAGVPLTEAIAVGEITDCEGETLWDEAILVPKKLENLGNPLRQASDYTDSQDNFREDALERDAERLDDVLAILSGEAPEVTLERYLRNSGAGLKNNLKSLGFIVRFDAKGDCTVTRHETA